jgi:hypothetical protein
MADVIVDLNLPSIRKAFDFAWMTFKNQSGLFIAMMLTFFASWVILEAIVVAGQRFGFLLWAIAHLSFFVIFAGLEIGFIRVCLACYDGNQIHYSDISGEFRYGANFLFVQLIYFVMSIIGFVLLVVPGAYLSAKYGLYAFHFAEEDLNRKGSFQQSAMTSQGSRWFLFWFSIVIFLFNILGASLLGIGLLMTIPLSVLMKTSIYRQLRACRQ